jgi:hypothetical protein
MGSSRHQQEARASADQDSTAPSGTGADLLTIALLVFFVSMLLIVAAMLVLPAIVQ